MKQILFILSLVILSNNHLYAQKTISKEEFYRLVDFANIQYVMAFIEKKDVGTPYFTDTYEKRIRPVLEKADLDNPESIINYERLEELLYNNEPALELAKRINDRKGEYDEHPNDEALIKSLSTTGYRGIDLSGISADIQNKLIAKYSSQNRQDNLNDSENEIVVTPTIQTASQVEDLHQKAFRRFRLIAYTLFGAILVFILYFFFYFKRLTLRELIIQHVLGSKRIEKHFARQVNALPYKLTDKDLNVIVDRVLECKALNKIDDLKATEIDNTGKPDLLIPAVKYLKGKSGITFSRVENTPENSFFKLVNEKDDIAQFEFCGDEAEAIAKRVFHEDICNIAEGGYQFAQHVKTLKPGKIKRIGNHWQVIERTEIKL